MKLYVSLPFVSLNGILLFGIVGSTENIGRILKTKVIDRNKGERTLKVSMWLREKRINNSFETFLWLHVSALYCEAYYCLVNLDQGKNGGRNIALKTNI